MSYHEGSNWQSRKEDEGKPLYEKEPAIPIPKEDDLWNEAIEFYLKRREIYVTRADIISELKAKYSLTKKTV